MFNLAANSEAPHHKLDNAPKDNRGDCCHPFADHTPDCTMSPPPTNIASQSSIAIASETDIVFLASGHGVVAPVGETCMKSNNDKASSAINGNIKSP